MLDTDILSDLVRNPAGGVAERIRQCGETNIRTSVVVAAELRFGAAKKGSDRLSAQLHAVLSVIEICRWRRLPTASTADYA